MEYPGYSIYKGIPKSDRINLDAEVVYSYLVNDLGFLE
jgi:hypothetical protein